MKCAYKCIDKIYMYTQNKNEYGNSTATYNNSNNNNNKAALLAFSYDALH